MHPPAQVAAPEGDVTAGYKGISGNWETGLEASPTRSPVLSATGIFIESFQLVFKKDTHGFS